MKLKNKLKLSQFIKVLQIMQKQLEQTARELKIRNYSPKAAKSYFYTLKEYFTFKKYNLGSLNTDNIRNLVTLSLVQTSGCLKTVAKDLAVLKYKINISFI